MIIRPLTEISEFQQCFELQRAVFGLGEGDLFPIRFYVVLNAIGGLVLGALEEDRVVGYVNSMPGIRDGKPYWYSQVMAVAKDHWNSGTASKLKMAQREHALQRGLRRIEWTFDPLESKNAYLNIAKLGVIVRHYHVNYYARIDSALHTGLDSDRLVAEWWIGKPCISAEPAQGDVRRVYIPADLQTLKKQSLKSAQDVQLRVREQFSKNFQDDYFVAGFERKDEWSEYLFLPGASRVYPTD
jgi:predicted GNAT superfamily acetyltransferase